MTLSTFVKTVLAATIMFYLYDTCLSGDTPSSALTTIVNTWLMFIVVILVIATFTLFELTFDMVTALKRLDI